MKKIFVAFASFLLAFVSLFAVPQAFAGADMYTASIVASDKARLKRAGIAHGTASLAGKLRWIHFSLSILAVKGPPKDSNVINDPSMIFSLHST